MAKLTRDECEAAILEHLKAIRGIAAEYAGRPQFIRLTSSDRDGIMMASNDYFDVDADKPIDFIEYDGKPLKPEAQNVRD